LSDGQNTGRVQTVQPADTRVGEPFRRPPVRPSRRDVLTGGGTAGNERLTSITGAILIALLAVLGITILRIGQLIWLHLFLGLLLLGPLALKMASTGYRFARYYTSNASYRAKGPPAPAMRLLAPLVVASTAIVFASGILLLRAGPGGRDQYLFLHKASFVVWLGVTAVHVLGHLPVMARSLRPGGFPDGLRGSPPGAAGRLVALVAALACGAVLAVALIPQFTPWTAHTSVLRHDH
jgi:hypothetical protein